MRFKFTFLLLLLNAVVFGLIVYMSNDRSQSSDSENSLASILSAGLTNADKITLDSLSLSEPMLLARDGTKWALEAPLKWPANQFAVNRILNQLQFIEDEASFSISEIKQNGQNLSDYGLEEPTVNLTIESDNKTYRIGFGHFTEIGNNIYVLGPEQDRIYVVKRSSVDGVLLSLNDLRRREIFEIPVFEIQELSLQIRSTDSGSTGDLKVRLSKNQNQWRFEAPLEAEANTAEVSNTINTLASAGVLTFLDEEIGDNFDLGLKNPFLRITLFGNKRRQTLLIGNRVDTDNEQLADQYYAQLEGNSALFTVKAAPFDALLLSQEALRERSFVDLKNREIDSIFISEGTRQTRLQKTENGNWQVLESISGKIVNPYRADLQIVQKLIDDIQRFRAIEFTIDSPTSVDLDRLGFNQPRRIVDITFHDGEKLQIEIAHPENENRKLFARTDQAEFIYTVGRQSTLRALPLNSLYYRERSLETLPGSAPILSIEIIDTQSKEFITRLERESSEEPWIVALVEFEQTQREALETIRDHLRDFRVKAFLKESFDDAFPLEGDNEIPWSFKIITRVLYPGSEDDEIREFEYYITKRLSGTSQIGGSPKHNIMFELPQTLIEALHVFTSDLEMPPEAKGEPLLGPEPVAPLPKPEPIEAE